MASLRRSTVRWSASACLVFLFVGAIGGCGSETTADVTNAVEAEALRILGNNMARYEVMMYRCHVSSFREARNQSRILFWDLRLHGGVYVT
jgi:hypothetical protein